LPEQNLLLNKEHDIFKLLKYNKQDLDMIMKQDCLSEKNNVWRLTYFSQYIKKPLNNRSSANKTNFMFIFF